MVLTKDAITAAIRRIEESRSSHQAWVDHIPNCEHCSTVGVPQYIQTLEEHQKIVEEYDQVLMVLRQAYRELNIVIPY
jgi:predicted metal-binding protein